MKRISNIILFLIIGFFILSCAALQNGDDSLIEFARYNTGMSYGLEIGDSYAYITTNNGLLVIDITNPKKPNKISSLKLGQPVFALKVRDEKAYLAASDNGLVIVDISDSENPVIVGKYFDGGEVRRIDLVDHYCITSDFENGLTILDISDVTAPHKVGNIKYDRIRGFEVVDNLIYLVDLKAGLRIVDISEKANPVETTLIEETYGASSLAVKDSRLYLGFFEGLVKVYDLSAPRSPELLTEMRCPGEVSGLTAKENFLLINYKGVIMKDVSDLNNIIDMGYYRERRTKGGVHTMVYHNGYIFYVLHGLTILEIR